MSVNINKIIEQMSLQQKIGQMFIGNICGGENLDLAKQDLAEYHFGGLQFSGVFERFVRGGSYRPCGVCKNAPLTDVARFLYDIKHASLEIQGIPVIIGGDQEGGIGNSIIRRRNITIMPQQMGLGRTGNPQLTYQANIINAREVKVMGLDMIYGPSLDINSNPLNPEIGIRSFGEDPKTVAEHGAAVIRACADVGIISNAKHFPGRGHGCKNAHQELESIDLDMERLQEVELVPFRRAVDEGVDSIMLAHTIFPALDSKLPASLSPAVVGYLRNQMGFNGVIIPDTLTMFAISHNYQVPQAAALCIEAGADMIFMKVRDLYQPCIDAIVESVRVNRLTEERINESVARVIKLKADKGLFSTQAFDPEKISKTVGCAEHVNVMHEIHRQTIAILKDNNVKPSGDSRVLVIQPRDMDVVMANDDVMNHHMLARSVARQGFAVTDMVIDQEPTSDQSFEVIARAKNADTIVWGIYSNTISDQALQLLREMTETGKPVIVVLATSPYVADILPPEVQKVICTFGISPLGFDSIML